MECIAEKRQGREKAIEKTDKQEGPKANAQSLGEQGRVSRKSRPVLE